MSAEDMVERAYRRCPDGDRPTTEPGGCECEGCGCIFIGAAWHLLCAVCETRKQTARRAALNEGDAK